MNTKTVLSYLLVLIIGLAAGFFVGKGSSKGDKDNQEGTNTSKHETLKGEDYSDWLHVDLLKYLQTKGFDFKAEQTQSGSFRGVPMDYKGKDGEVYVRLHETMEKAQNKASGLGTKGFSWGKFMFKSDNEELLKNISAVLDNKYNDDYELLKSVITTESTTGKSGTGTKGNMLEKIDLEKVNTGYYTGGGIWAPCVVLTFKNISDEDITNQVGVEVVFFDETEKEQLSAKTKYLVGVVTNTRLATGNSRKIDFSSELGWNKIPDNKKISAKIYVDKALVKTVPINDFEISLLGKKVTLHGDVDF